MTFSQLSARAILAQFDLLGEAVSHHPKTGQVSTLQVIIDKDVDVIPGVFDSGVGATQTQISFKKTDAAHIRRGEIIESSGGVYSLQDIVLDDGVEVRYSARLENG